VGQHALQRERPPGHQRHDQRPARGRELADELLLRAGQTDVGAAVGLAAQDGLLAQEQQDRIGAGRRLERLGEALAAAAAGRLQRARVAHLHGGAQGVADGLQRRAAVLRSPSKIQVPSCS